MTMSRAHRLVDAFLAGDVETALGLMADDATFHSPVRSYRGAETVRPLWTALAGIVEDARAARHLAADGEVAAFFEGTIGPHRVDGVLHVRAPAGGPVTDVTLMLRPLEALRAGIAEMTKRLEADGGEDVRPAA
jgi:hypothetical protein